MQSLRLVTKLQSLVTHGPLGNSGRAFTTSVPNRSGRFPSMPVRKRRQTSYGTENHGTGTTMRWMRE